MLSARIFSLRHCKEQLARYGKGILAADERGGKNEGEASDRLSFRRLLNELLSHHGRQVPSLSTGVDSLY